MKTLSRSLMASLLISPPLLAEQITDQVSPESGTATQMRAAQTAQTHMVVAAHPLAAQAGLDILRQGGSAADATVAVQLVLGLVEPQSSGIGGGAFTLYYDAKQQQLITLDGRETAPQTVDPRQFLDANGEPLAFYEAVVGGRSVGTPGTLKLLWTLHQRAGVLPWSTLLEPAIQLAEQGFEISPRLAGAIAKDALRLQSDSTTAAYFLDSAGLPLVAGTRLKNPAYANTLRQLSEGIAPFYQGDIANAIVHKVQQASAPGALSLADLQNYQVKERPPVCSDFLSYRVCGMGPPSSGALTVGQILTMTQYAGIAKRTPDDPISWQMIGDATRLAFADRGRYMADSDYIDMPTTLLDKTYLAQRAGLIQPGKRLEDVQPGTPPELAAQWADDTSPEFPSTSHFTIRDSHGNIISMTTTIENGFGSRLMVNGFLLNNELTDFAFAPEQDGNAVANRIEPGKRPRSSMSPTLVFKDQQPYLAIGSPGGSRIISYVANSLIRHLAWDMPIDAAINAPHLVNRFGTYDVELDPNADQLAQSLETLGYNVKRQDLNSGLHALLLQNGLQGAADKRREGIAVGD